MRLHYRIDGSGPPLVVLHGLFGSLDNWQPLNRRFATQFQVVALDLRNHGRSPHAEGMSYDLMAEDVAEVLRSEGMASAFVLGHSMGGKTAMALALRRPESVRKLVVVDMSPAAQPPRHTGILRALAALDLATFQTRQEIERALAPEIPDAQVRRFLLKSLAFEPGHGFRWRMGLREIAVNYAGLNEAIESAQPFRGPTLFLRGELSEYLPESDLGLIRSLFRHARLHTIPQAGHWLHAEAPDAVYAAVTEFLVEEAGM